MDHVWRTICGSLATGDGVEVENGVRNDAQGGIITLVAKIQSTFRLSPQTLDVVQRLADKLGKPRPDILELAIAHLEGTLNHDQPVYISGPPDDEPKSHKRGRSAA